VKRVATLGRLVMQAGGDKGYAHNGETGAVG
jgi:hypothetical protein